MTGHAHPELMSKPVLIQHYREAAAAARKWQARYRLARYAELAATMPSREQTPDEVLDEARELFILLPPDPNARQHAHDLIAELDALCPYGRCNRPADACTTHNQEKTA